MSESRLPLTLIPVTIAPAVLALSLLLIIAVLALVGEIIGSMKSLDVTTLVCLYLIFGARLLTDVLTLALSATIHPVSLISDKAT